MLVFTRCAGVRDEMTQFWSSHSRRASTVEMMLDTDAERLGEKEIPEILSLLPDVKGKDVIELGAGIGCVNKHIFASLLKFLLRSVLCCKSVRCTSCES